MEYQKPKPYSPSLFFATTFILCACASLGPVWSGTFLPLTDLPQHIAQIAVLKNYTNPIYQYERFFELNYFTPYLVAIFLGKILSMFFPVIVAVKILLSIAIISWPIALLKLLKENNGDPEWSLIGFPLAFGASYFWGHLPFILAIPWSLYCWNLAFRYQRTSSTITGIQFALSMMLLFFCHAVPFAITIMVSSLIFCGWGIRKFYWRHFLSLVPSFLLLVIWMRQLGHDHSLGNAITWQLGWHRIFEIPQLIMGIEGDRTSHIAFIGIVVGFFLFPRRQKPGIIPYSPLICILIFCLILPFQISDNINYFAQRLTIFLIPAFLLTYERHPTSTFRNKLATIWIASVFIIWAGVLSVRVIQFNKEADSFKPVLEKMAPNKKLAGIVLDKKSAIPSFLPYVHFAAYYQALKGGTFEYTFSNVSQIVVRYKAAERLSPEELTFSWKQIFDNPKYDYYLLRLPQNTVIEEKKNRKLVIQSKTWFLYERM